MTDQGMFGLRSKRSHSRNPFASRDAEIKRLKAQIESMHDDRLLEPFCKELSESIMVMLTVIPMSEWPDFAKTALRQVSDKMPAIAELWRERKRAMDSQ